MPESEVQRLLAENLSVTQMALHFKVSQDAMANRLKSLRIYA